MASAPTFPPQFKDLGKNANTLVNKGYYSVDKYHLKFELETTSDNGIQFISHVTENLTGGFESELKSKFKCRGYEWTLSTNQKQEVNVEAAGSNFYGGYVKPTFSFNTNVENPVDRAHVKLNSETRFKNTNITESIDLPASYWLPNPSVKAEHPKATISAVLGGNKEILGGFIVGAEAEVSAESVSQPTAINFIGAYSQSNVDFSLFYKRRQNATIGANFHQKVFSFSRLQDASVAGEITNDLSADKQPLVTLAATARAENTTFKTRISSKGVLGLAITQKFDGPLSVTLQSDIQTTNLREPNSIQWGIKLAYK